ncbi:MAG: SH3 domain-containing protein [Chloroherpetonaceae bacterium]
MLNRALLVALFSFLVAPLLAQGTNATTMFNEASNLYTAGKYREALALYTALDSLGYQSGELHYNIGNTYYKIGQIGKAVLYYEKAKRFIDGDEDLQTNLELALARTKDKIPELPKFFLESLLEKILNVFSLGGLGFFVLLFLYGTATIFIFQLRDLFGLNSLVGQIFKYMFLVLFSLSLILFVLKSSRLATYREAVILNPVVNLKSEPREQSATISVIHEGLKVEISRKESNWLEVKLPDGTKGWIEEREAGEI